MTRGEDCTVFVQENAMSPQLRWICCILLVTACVVGCTHVGNRSQDGYAELDALIAYLQMLGTLVEFDKVQPGSLRQ